MMILELRRQRLSPTAIARQLSIDRKMVNEYVARGIEPPVYGPRQPRPKPVDPYLAYPILVNCGNGWPPIPA